MKKLKSLLSVFLALALLIINPVSAEAITEKDEIFSAMLARAEAFVNYEWVPTQDIEVWNENPYNGKMYFPAGEVVKGVPYTLFFSELGVDSLLSLEEFKSKVDINYSTTAYCNSVGAMRTGPVYGSCCATFVSEVFGGNFVSGNSPKYDSVSKIINSGHCETSYGIKAVDIQPGDALSNISGSHIVWVGEVTDSYITIYEETPPVARKVTLDFDTNVYSDGYLHYGDSSNENSNIYNVVTKPNELSAPVYEVDETYEQYCPFKAYPCVTENFEVFKSDLATHGGEIYTNDYCTVFEVYTNGWCKVNFPLDSGGTITAYTPISNFIENPNDTISSFTAEEYIELFPTKSMGTRIYRIYPNDTCDYFGNADICTQLFMPHNDGYYVLGWADISKYADVNFPDTPVISGISVAAEPYKTIYEIGEAFDTTGLALQITYSDGSSETVTSGFTVSKPDMATAGTKSVTVTYEGKTASFNITVNKKEIPPIDNPIFKIEKQTVKQGETFTVDVKIENNPGIVCLQLLVSYDTDALELISAKGKDFSNVAFGLISNVPFAFSWTDAVHPNNTTNGNIVELTFKVKDTATVGKTNIKLSYDEENVYDSDFENVFFEIENGEINIIDYILGDVNGDGTINFKDLGLLQRKLNRIDIEIDELASDINKDGTVNFKDLGILQKYLNGDNNAFVFKEGEIIINN